ncbi:hypothetical protein [Aeromicrobium sp.]|uniref:hypothetical protein n=1 Tax=Aeromicrobium sp. TaxID=1871063 RepID=UPI0019CB8333|nr:hypothetical protein [Aeromicrobium sp.]MBC7632776.1 hypothetical protein [Aeromicrobium sp.]
MSYAGHTQPLWHEWVGDAVCLVTGGTEQPLPGITDQHVVTLMLRSKSTRALVAEAEALVEVVAPGSEHWDSVTTALRTGRLNLGDKDHAVERWSRECIVIRLVPTGQVTVAGAIDSSIGHTAPLLSS